MMTEVNWPKLVRECLESTEFMALATKGEQGLWNHAVYFAFDDKCNCYFMSQPGSRHMRNILAYEGVAAEIYATDQDPAENAIGLQVRGKAMVLGGSQVDTAHKIYYDRARVLNGIASDLTEFQGPDAAWKLVKVEPIEIGYFNAKLFGEQRQTVPEGTSL
jgi:uncharacterized protein YhbP (UPF0306 family)